VTINVVNWVPSTSVCLANIIVLVAIILDYLKEARDHQANVVINITVKKMRNIVSYMKLTTATITLVLSTSQVAFCRRCQTAILNYVQMAIGRSSKFSVARFQRWTQIVLKWKVNVVLFVSLIRPKKLVMFSPAKYMGRYTWTLKYGDQETVWCASV
jgi:hypothetical protein